MQQKHAKTNDFRQSLGPGTKEMALAGRKYHPVGGSMFAFRVRSRFPRGKAWKSGCQTPNFNAQFWGVQTFNFRQVSPSHLTCPNSICSRVFMQQVSVENSFSKCSTELAGCRLKCKSDGPLLSRIIWSILRPKLFWIEPWSRWLLVGRWCSRVLVVSILTLAGQHP